MEETTSESVQLGLNSDVHSDRVLIVEGSFDAGFFRALLNYHDRRRVQIITIEGRDNFPARAVARLLSDDKEQLRWIGLANDADDNPTGAVMRLQGVLRRFNEKRRQGRIGPLFGVPSTSWVRSNGESGRSATLFVFPSATEQGDVERWIWSAMDPTSPIVPCVESFVDCLTQAGHPLPRPWKTRVFAYLSAQARPEMPLNIAARAARLPMDADQYIDFVRHVPADDEAL